MSEVKLKAGKARSTAAALSRLTTSQKNEALQLMADSLRNHQDDIIAANKEDLERGKAQGTSSSLLDRLALNPQRIEAIAEGLEQIISLPDPIGDVLDSFERPNGLQINKTRVPLGVIGIIYEARPNVTVDAAGLCLKAGNAVVLRGGSSALSSNRKIVEVLHSALRNSALPAEAIQLIESPDRSSVDEMLKLNGLLDVIIPRGGQSLIRNVVENATVPVIETGAGICHTYVDETADSDMAEAIAINAKVQRPSVCNSMETLIVNSRFAADHLGHLADQLRKSGVEIRGCAETVKLVPWAVPAQEQDFATEYNDYILNVKLVDTLDEALDHISRFSTKHSECIVTENKDHAERFLQEVDAAAVYHNASTRFTDGFEFGFGAEIGISTQKLHARGPMGLPALTSTKYIIHGNGQIRG
ncbi:glutamate-5-semialdehyde dehydrogenase [Paenibacillus sp.]|jgi:glutamate-5-semialdehyde dehydrogenase|uniref:glutamate-5-semialdehyde dehydrogenase n=1 Tax=Paenibacillus sp. TaxID=58172 RepID=UPI00282CF255|nr:glutamate-5-semialdehyde dehydrogenase [Paenibacillus sp.]MDR0270666.1 glutamate-5-semialdehyde dehydrogenase [Paenibacillus sp.]